ncbi:MAG: Do family serine endopeptidase [Spirochaetaceae bacterium]|jgi:Do/DeqQ family serine protease|nr:Do family serine endopeptidase [Spirochaetaceae bacterium]
MNSWTKRLCLILAGIVLGAGLFFFACNTQERSQAQTAYAESGSGIKLPAESLGVLEAMQNVFRAVSESVLPSVVELDVVEKRTGPANPFGFIPFFGNNGEGQQREYEQQGLGSGVIVRKSGKTYYVLTNNHVAGKATEISVKLKDGRGMTGKLIGADSRKDIALVSFESDDSDIPVAVLGDSDTVHVGDICFAMGTPLGFDSSVTQGIVSAIGRSGGHGIDNISEFIQTDAAINQGNSGGPLVNIYGEVIGINTWIASPSGASAGLGFAITINNVKKAIDDFISSGKITYGWMGVALVEIDKSYKEELGIGDKIGAFASQVYLDSPAAKGGIMPGDFVIQLNGRGVKSVSQLVREVGDLKVNEKAAFVVIRDGKEVTLSVTIEARKEDTASNSSRLWPGFNALPLTAEVRKTLNLDSSLRGVVIANVQARSPAAAMRLNNNEVITAVNDKKISNLREFYSALNLTGKAEVWFDVRDSDGNVLSTRRYKLP